MMLALYAQTALDNDLVPIVEAEIEMDGRHDSNACRETTQLALEHLFEAIDVFGLDTAKIILKTNFIVPGQESSEAFEVAKSAEMTFETLLATVPENVPLIAFLSGGLRSGTSIALLEAISGIDMPWRATFSFGRALWAEPLMTWGGDPARVGAAQRKLAGLAAHSSKVVQ